MKNSLFAHIKYNPWSDNTYTGMLKKGISFIWGKKKSNVKRPKRIDDIAIEIFKKHDEEDNPYA